MKDLSQITCCFVDHHGLYLPLAQRLSESYKRVLYFDPKEEAFETVNDAVIGESYPPNERLEVIGDFWEHKKEINLFVFPDSKGAGLQKELLSQGYPVWGSVNAIYLEQNRGLFLDALKSVELETPKWQRIHGLTKLREYLKPRENQVIKISQFRGTMETRKWTNYEDGEGWLDFMEVILGGVREHLPFFVFESIDTPFELGGDTINVRGKWPENLLDGYEWKDKGYFGAWKPRTEMPEQTQAVMEKFGPILGTLQMANFWSMEIMVRDDHFYFIDATPRGPLPAGPTQTVLITNLPEVIAAGAESELVEPEASHKFSCECILSMKNEEPMWGSVRIPKELEPWVKLSGYCMVNGRTWFPPGETHGEDIGWMVALGNTPRETVETMLDQVSKLPDGVTAHTESLAELLKEIHKAEEEGVAEFTPMALPEPAIVVEHDEE